MKKETKTDFGQFDIPLSCSVFLEPSLKKHKRHIAPISDSVSAFISDWNKALLEVVSRPIYAGYLKRTGHQIIRGSLLGPRFSECCVDFAEDVSVQSLHYALRFSESINFLTNKIISDKNVKFVDFGCGFSPMAAAVQTEYNLSDVYCIDMPEIMDVYGETTNLMGAKTPQSISWPESKKLAKQGDINTFIGMGVFPYLEVPEQIGRLNCINANFENFMVEIKYNNNDLNGVNPDSKFNVFNNKTLQKLRLEASSTETLETAMVRNSIKYLRKFISAMPDRRYFLAKDRSLFLSR